MQFACISVTAVHPEKQPSEIIELAIVVIDEKGRILRTFDTLVDPGSDVASQITDDQFNFLGLHTINWQEHRTLLTAPLFFELIPEIVDTLRDCSYLVDFSLDLHSHSSSTLLDDQFRRQTTIYPGISCLPESCLALHGILHNAGVRLDGRRPGLREYAEVMGIRIPEIQFAGAAAFYGAALVARVFAECLRLGYMFTDPNAQSFDCLHISDPLTRERLAGRGEREPIMDSRLEQQWKQDFVRLLGWLMMSSEGEVR
jgi:hypothetical protein